MSAPRFDSDRNKRSNGRETYAGLLDAALAIWSEEGIDQVAMERVAKRAGRTRGVVYHHFRNRDELITALHSHLDERLAHLFDFAKTPSRNDYLIVAGLTADSPEIIRGFLLRLLAGDPASDSLLKVARDHYDVIEKLGWLRPGMSPDHAVVISLAMWLASMLAVNLKDNPADRRAEAFAFAETFQRVMEQSVIVPR